MLSCGVTTLVVDELNSDTGQLESLAEWIAGVDKHIPIHLSRYYPAYQMDGPPTRLDTGCRQFKAFGIRL